MTEETAYPLSWPHGRPRTLPHQRTRSAFSRESAHALTLEQARRQLEDELRRLGVHKFILSTNVQLRQDGYPYSGRKAPDDPGVAVYFTLLKRPTVLACDKWDRVPDNIRAIVKHIDALRGQERWGVGSIEQAFAGYVALPAPGQATERSWRSVFECTSHDEITTLDELSLRYRRLAMERRGDEDLLRELNVARDQAREELAA